MPLVWLLIILCLLSNSAVANERVGFDSQPVSWLLEQVYLAEARNKPVLFADSLERLLRVDPENLAGLAALTRYQFSQKQRVNALTTLYQIRTLNPNYQGIAQLNSLKAASGKHKIDFQRARLLARAGRVEEALASYRQIFPSGMPTPQLRFDYIGLIARTDNSWGNTHKLFKQLVDDYPNIARFDIALAQHILQRTPTDQYSHNTLAKYASLAEHRANVERIWLKVLSQLPSTAPSLKQINKFKAYFPGNSAVASLRKDFLIKLALQQQLDADLYYQAWLKGKMFMAAQHLKTANGYFIQALAGRSYDPEILGSMALLKMRQGKHQVAKRYFSKAAEQASVIARINHWQSLANTADFWATIALGRTAIDNQRYVAAATHFKYALSLDEDNQHAVLYLAKLNQAQGKLKQATNQFWALVRSDPNNQAALSGLLEILSLDQDLQSLNKFIARLSPSQRQMIKEPINRNTSAIYRQLADQAVNKLDFDRAQDYLNKALTLTPRNPWLYYDLASVYQQQQDQRADSVFEQALVNYPQDNELKYVFGFYLHSIEKYQPALDILALIPGQAADDDVVSLQGRIKQAQLLQMIEPLISSNQWQLAASKLTSLASNSQLDATMRTNIAVYWQEIERPQLALAQLAQALEQDPQLAPYWHLLYGQWLLEQGNLLMLRQWFASSDTLLAPSEDQLQQFDQQYLSYLAIEIEGNDSNQLLVDYLDLHPASVTGRRLLITRLLNQDNVIAAFDQFVILRKSSAVDISLGLTIAQPLFTKQQVPLGQTLIANLIARVNVNQVYQHQLLMESLAQFEDQSLALQLADTLLANVNSEPELLNLAGELAREFGENQRALDYFEQVTVSQSASAGQGSSQPWYVGAAQRNMANIYAKSDGYIALGVNFGGQTSTQNDARFGASEVPVESYFPLFGGQAFVKIDPVSINAQLTDFTSEYQASHYGQGLLCYPRCDWLSIRPLDSGVDIGLGWQNEQWRFDIGTTPLGFLIEDLVWGVEYADDWGDFSWDIGLKKRPVVSSVLSYGGLEDVVTGNIWGGVRATGLTLGLYHDLGLKWGYWSTIDFQRYQGVNVKSNNRFRAMAGTYYRVIQQIDLELSVGASLLHWGYDNNQSEETYGHGGYYSPQSYLGLSIPVSLDGRYGLWSYRLKAGVSVSSSKNDAADYFPNDSALQSAAHQLSNDPIHTASSSSGFSYSIGGAVEYRVTPHWSIGGSLNFDRADFYQPNVGQLYIRYRFNPQYGAVPFPPQQIVPYANL